MYKSTFMCLGFKILSIAYKKKIGVAKGVRKLVRQQHRGNNWPINKPYFVGVKIKRCQEIFLKCFFYVLYFQQIFAIQLPVEFFFPALDTKYQLLTLIKTDKKRKKKICDYSLNGKTTKTRQLMVSIIIKTANQELSCGWQLM